MPEDFQDPDDIDTDPDLREGVWIKCQNCEKEFRLLFTDGIPSTKGPSTLRIAACLSGGIYGVDVICPHCKHKEDIYD